MKISERLYDLRKDKKISQEELANALGVSRQSVSKWETGESTPDFDKIIPLCKFYGITSDELLTGKKESVDNSNKFVIDTKENMKKRTIGLVTSILLYFVAVAWIMVSIPALDLDPIISSAIFILICGVSTCILVYTRIMYKKEKTKIETKQDKLYKQIDDIAGLITVIIYLVISFITMAWHITWIIWIIYALIMEIIKLIISLRGDKDE